MNAAAARDAMHSALTASLTVGTLDAFADVQLGLAMGPAMDTAAAPTSGVQQPDTANTAFNKLAGVLAYLCAEVARLRRHVGFAPVLGCGVSHITLCLLSSSLTS
jgi:hypothetical protein